MFAFHRPLAFEARNICWISAAENLRLATTGLVLPRASLITHHFFLDGDVGRAFNHCKVKVYKNAAAGLPRIYHFETNRSYLSPALVPLERLKYRVVNNYTYLATMSIYLLVVPISPARPNLGNTRTVTAVTVEQEP